MKQPISMSTLDPRSLRGWTMIELVVTCVIISVVLLGLVRLGRFLGINIQQGISQTDSTFNAQQLFTYVEQDLAHANEIIVATTTRVTFIADWNRTPGYSPTADQDGDLIANSVDADYDGDLSSIVSAADQWKVGNNLKDDDDDGDAKIDFREQIMFYSTSSQVFRSYSINQADWGSARRIIDHVMKFQISYFGSAETEMGKPLDTNSDGLVTVAEMDVGADGSMATVDAGQGDGWLDKKAELALINSLRLLVELDSNNDGTSDYTLESEIYPPLLPLKTIQQ